MANQKNKKSLSIDKLKLKDIFVFNWASGTMVFALLVACAWFYVQNSSLKEDMASKSKTIKTLKANQNSLQVDVATLKGSNEAYSNTIKTFMDNPPGPMNLRITNVETWLGRKFGYGSFLNVPAEEFSNRAPEIN